MIYAIIPARGGSKGIPRKNLAMVCGRPLISWSIEQALSARLVDSVIVSTDCSEIGRFAIDCGAQWLMRGDDTATDTAPTELALLEALDVLAPTPDAWVLLQPTSPIRQPDDIDNAIEKFQKTRADSLFSARHVEGYTWTLGGQHLTPNYCTRERRQIQSVRRLEENGSIYVYRSSTLMQCRNRLGGRIEYYEMHPLDSFQIDVPADIKTIECILPSRLGLVEA